MATINEILLKAKAPNAAGNLAAYFINVRHIQTPYPELDPITGIMTGEFNMPATSLVPNPEILKISGAIEESMLLLEEPLIEKGSKAKRYTLSFTVAKNNPNIALVENRNFKHERYVVVVIDNNGFAQLLGWVNAPGRVDRSATSGQSIGSDRNEVNFTYTVEMTEAAPYYTSASGDAADPFNIVYP